VIPQFPLIIGGSFLFLGAFHILSPFLSNNWAHFYYEFKFLSFIFLTYYFYTLEFKIEDFIKKYDFILFALSALILVFAFNDFYNYRIDRSDIQSGFLLGSFGNVNMLAEFLVLSLPLIHLWTQTKSSILSSLKYFILFGWLFFIFYCRSRSVWIGCGLWFAWAIFNKRISLKEIALILLAFALYQFAVLTPAVAGVALADKQNSFSQRLHLYKSTLALIKDHPIGVGVGQYQNEILPYMVNSEIRPFEYVYFDQPHSEILKWAVQFGWLGFLIPALLFGYLAFHILKQKNFFLFSSFLTLVPQIAFQFPFENPATLMYLGFLFALTLKIFPAQKEIELSFLKRLPIFFIASIGIWNAFAFVSSVFMETSHQNKIENIMYSCEVYPINVNACFNRNHFLISSNNPVLSRMTLAQDLGKFPFHAGLLRLFPIYFKNIGNEKKSCEAVLMYNFIFEKQSFFNTEVIKRCSEYKQPVTFYSPEQFKNDYINWQRQVLQ
jgi:hypothetical protein